MFFECPISKFFVGMGRMMAYPRKGQMPALRCASVGWTAKDSFAENVDRVSGQDAFRKTL
jgi:hypothetical protein